MEPHEAVPAPVQMVQMLAGFQLSQALYVAAKLGIPDALSEGEQPVDAIAAKVGAQPDGVRRLLRALASLGVVSDAGDDVYDSTPLGETLASDTPGSMRDLALMWMETHYAPFGDLLTTVRTGEPAAQHHYGMPFFDWLAPQPEQVARFSRAMANLTDGIKMGAMLGYDFGDVATVVDIGGADGSMLAAVLASKPAAKGIVFDLPHVVPAAERLLGARGLEDRVSVVGGDFFDGVPTGGDVYLESFVLHDWNDDECVRILENIRAAAPAARLVMVEFVVPAGNEPHMSKMIDLTMLAMLTGRERTAADWEALLARAGWRLDRIVPTPTPVDIIEATAA